MDNQALSDRILESIRTRLSLKTKSDIDEIGKIISTFIGTYGHEMKTCPVPYKFFYQIRSIAKNFHATEMGNNALSKLTSSNTVAVSSTIIIALYREIGTINHWPALQLNKLFEVNSPYYTLATIIDAIILNDPEIPKSESKKRKKKDTKLDEKDKGKGKEEETDLNLVSPEPSTSLSSK